MKGAGASGSFLEPSSITTDTNGEHIATGGADVGFGCGGDVQMKTGVAVGFGGNVQTKIGKVDGVKQLKGVRGFMTGCCIGVFSSSSLGSSSVYLNIKWSQTIRINPA